jgi:hypothetical protein
MKTEALIKGMSMLGYAAANVGEREVRTGYDSFIERTGGADFPFISANIVRSDTKQPVFRPSIVIEVPGSEGEAGAKLGVVGVARFNPIFRKPGPDGTQLEIIHPVEAVRKEVASLRKQGVDLVILLAALHRDDARRIVREVRGIDFVIGSYGGVFMTEKEPSTESWILYSGNQGKQLGETRLFLEAGEQRADPVNKLHYLSNAYPTDPDMVRYVNSVSLEPAKQVSRVLPRGSGPFLGSAKCAECHTLPHSQWSKTSHAHALDSLKRKNNHGKPECLRCHTTGAGMEGGFKSLEETPQLANVGCESCHGAGRAHLENSSRPYGAIKPGSCTGCHDVQNSPDFDFYTYFAKVAHREQAER